MKAIIFAACHAALKGEPAEIYSDSAYAINSFSIWMHSWFKNGWKKAKGDTPENLDLIQCFYELNQKYKINFHLVRGHNNNKYNELADKLAVNATV